MRLLGIVSVMLAMCLSFAVRGEIAADAAKAAAEKGDAAAQFRYAEMLRTGNGVATNLTEAAVWTRKAAEQNHVEAQNNLGCYHAKFMDKESQRLAVKWLKAAAKEDYADAEYNLAKLYLNPHHPASKEQGAGRRAISLLRLAAAQNHVGAKRMLEELGCDTSHSPTGVDELKQRETVTFINNY